MTHPYPDCAIFLIFQNGTPLRRCEDTIEELSRKNEDLQVDLWGQV